MNILRPEATKLRDEGYSYSYIASKLGISKSTLSGWFRNRSFVPNDYTLRSVAEGQRAYGELRRAQRMNSINTYYNQGKNEVGSITQRDLWMIGLGLWLGEGSKTVEQIRLANSDPAVISLWVKWLHEICGARDDNIVVRMHLYPDNDEDVCRNYWMKITELPAAQFRKVQIDKRGSDTKVIKKNKLPYGTLHILLSTNGNPNFGVALSRRLRGWIGAITESGAGEENRTPVA